MNLRYQLITEPRYPYDLLLLADETVSAINRYLFDSEVYIVLNEENTTIGVFCLYEIDDNTVELKNIAISNSQQSKGLGSQVVTYIKNISAKKYKTLIVGTADCGFRQIKFYENNGFVKYNVRKDFFLHNYEEPIIENGVMLRDMVMLKYEL